MSTRPRRGKLRPGWALAVVGVADALVLGELTPMGLELYARELLRVGAEEELEQAEVSDLGRLGRRLRQPGGKRSPAAGRRRVRAAAPTAFLAPLFQQALLGQPRRLGVELRVRDRPEVARAARDRLLEVIGRARTVLAQEAEDDVARGREA